MQPGAMQLGCIDLSYRIVRSRHHDDPTRPVRCRFRSLNSNVGRGYAVLRQVDG